MATATMTFPEVYAQLEAWRNESRRAHNARNGAGDNQFGVPMGELRGLAKKLKRDHQLALELWESGNLEARILASMLFDPAQLTEQDAEALARSLSYHVLIDELVYNALSKAPCADTLRCRWMDSSNDLIGRAGWALLIARIAAKKTEDLDLPGIIERIEREVTAAPRRKQETMNRCLCEIGIRLPEYTEACIAVGERIGRLDPNERVPKGCTSSYAPEWIAAGIRNRRR